MDRQQMLTSLHESTQWDIVIIGGGATGLGSAVDAASRGYKTLLVEQSDFAKGTSSRSTKLVHGGVRYLNQGNIRLVRESLRERGILLKNAPHVCKDLLFILPSYSWWEKWYYGIGLKIYDLMSGSWSLGKTNLLSKAETVSALPAISSKKLRGAVSYHDGQFDDSRLAINLAQTAAEKGATVLNYCRLISIEKKSGQICGVTIEDVFTGKLYPVKCKALINATGVFTDSVMALDDPKHEPVITASQGIHIVVEEKFFRGKHALIIPHTDDGRVLFAVPWHNKVVIGTTDTPVRKIDMEPRPAKEEINFVLEHANRYLSTGIRHTDIKAVFAGLRPLLSSKKHPKTALLPRDHTIIISASGMITATGGKWTTYRIMGKQAVDNAAIKGKLEKKDCHTANLQIHGHTGNINSTNHFSIYGSDAAMIKTLAESNIQLNEKIHEELPYIKAELVWAVQQEMAVTVEDILARRTRALFLDAKAAIESASTVASLMASVMNKDEQWQEDQVKAFTEIASGYLINQA